MKAIWADAVKRGELSAEYKRCLIGVVRSTADKTARTSNDMSDFRARIRDRLDALAPTLGLLSRLEDRDRVSFEE